MLTHIRNFWGSRSFNNPNTSVMPKNQKAVAEITPVINGVTSLSVSVPRNAPNMRLVSIIACGFAQVTTHALTNDFFIGNGVLALSSLKLAAERKMPNPIQITNNPPTNIIINLNNSWALIIAPIPKNAASVKAVSANQTMTVTGQARFNGWLIALLKTNRFCIPIDETSAKLSNKPRKYIADTYFPSPRQPSFRLDR